MLAKTIVAIAAYVAFAPHSESLVVRIILSGLSVGVLSGLVGTASRGQPLAMIPTNAGEAAIVAVVVTTLLHLGTAQLAQARHSA